MQECTATKTGRDEGRGKRCGAISLCKPRDMKDVLRILADEGVMEPKEIELCAVMGPGSGFLWRHVKLEMPAEIFFAARPTYRHHRAQEGRGGTEK